ncbi:MAG: ATP-binding protein [Bacteroidales bacterium]
MELIHREILSRIEKKIQPGKVIMITGARRTGKTWLLKELIRKTKAPYLHLNGEDLITEDLLLRKGIAEYRQLLGRRKYLFIDEAQKISDIGRILKVMIDEIEGLHIIVTGSSAFDLTNKTGEPLTGRKYTYNLYPLAQCELQPYENLVETKSLLESRLLYGSYPEVLAMESTQEKQEYLMELASSYLLKDILAIDQIRNSSRLVHILRLIALQIGNEVSYNEIAQQVGMSKNTVERYLDLLSKVFIIFRIDGYSRNLRKEIAKAPRYYFWDTGVRNVLIANFNLLSSRNDAGALWENYLISERLKLQHYKGWLSNNYFWRTYDQQEIDWIEERGGKLRGYEMKYGNKPAKAPAAWHKTYPDANFQLINRDNYLNFLSRQEL